MVIYISLPNSARISLRNVTSSMFFRAHERHYNVAGTLSYNFSNPSHLCIVLIMCLIMGSQIGRKYKELKGCGLQSSKVKASHVVVATIRWHGGRRSQDCTRGQVRLAIEFSRGNYVTLRP